LEAARSLTRVDACNPLLQAHPTWARDEHEGRGIPTSLTPVSGCLASPPFALDPSGLGHAATLTRRPKGPPGLETPTISDYIEQFDLLLHQLLAHENHLTTTMVTTRFVDGLKDELRAVVIIQRPADLVSQFNHMFDEPKELPPKRWIDHAIPLI
jgi:hypothetical protein